MSDAKVRGDVHTIEETKSYGQKGFRKRLVVLTQDNGRFVNYIPIEFTQDACDDVDKLRVGDQVEVSYRLSGRKWQKDPTSEVKFFLSCEATSFRKLGSADTPDGSRQNSANDRLTEAAYEGESEVPF
jgi:hypothetical protein